MKISIFIAAIMYLFSSSLYADELNLMPYPQNVSMEEGNFVFDKNITLEVIGNKSPQLTVALKRFFQRVRLQTAIQVHAKKPVANTAKFIINIKNHLAGNSSFLAMDESYELTINSQQLLLSANTDTGALRGLETLLQLIGIQNHKINLPLVSIQDYPRFKWRGLLLDCSRHFFSVATIKRQLDAMAAAKYNVFHWHLTDDQGWRIESKKFPKLQQLASGGEYYTQADIRAVVNYAQQLGIQVLPEIDMPGHASALAIAYPELMSAPGPYQTELRWGVHQPTLNPANEKVFEFIDQLIAEVVELFPFEYIHIGGDEVDPEQWNANPDVKQFMLEQNVKDAQSLQAYFNQRLVKILTTHKRKMIGWDEIQHPDLPKDIVIQSWRGPDAVADAIHNNFQAILSTGFYLDQPQPAAYHYRNDPIPSGEIGNDQLNVDDQWQSWSFSMPRKRGNAVTGSFTIITAKNGKQHGFIDFKNKSRRELQTVKVIHDVMQFNVDTWMGNVIFKMTFNNQSLINNNSLSGVAIVGNAPYVLTGEQIAGSDHSNKKLPETISQPSLSPEQSELVLGGEAALWTEIVDENSIDLRLWPRAFAVGERLWSSKNLQDEESLYRRMDAVATWSRISVGVRDQQQETKGIQKLAGKSDAQPLQVLAEAVESAQYYHRQHEKSAHATYSKQDALNQFVDSLPAENEIARRLQKTISRLLENHQDLKSKNEAITLFSRWQNNYQTLLDLIGKNAELSALLPVATKVNEISNLGEFLIRRMDSGKSLSQVEIAHMQQVIRDAQQLDNEMIVAAAYSVEMLLNSSY